eukprot:TRINITY_DN16422_c0_g1_i2.p1 TRINITY_DN16422_c0_g1~~TRINITY_DN16422_c0_g1_i2.p1  ORF type:complete len:219 (-),score=38.57 TRINITY_DN16422_c0_g1_i2:301-957(-)
MEAQMQKDLRNLARECTKAGKHTEAFFHLTHALNADPDNLELLQMRAKALIQCEQYNLALMDADKVMSLAPNSGMGHTIRADIYFTTFNYDKAIENYKKGFQCKDGNKEYCMEGINKCKKEIVKDKELDRQYPYIGCALGIFISSVILVLDYLSFGKESYVAHPLLKVASTGLAAGICYSIGLLYRRSVKHLRRALLEPPPDLFNLNDKEDDVHPHED